MSARGYTFSIQNDTPNHRVDTDRLTLDYQLSAIVTALDHIGTEGDVLTVWAKDVLSAGDIVLLTSLVHSHSGDPLPEAVQPVLITGADNLLPIIPKGFPDYTGYPRLVKGVRGEMSPGQRNFVYVSFNYKVVIQGGTIWADDTAEWGDFIDVEMTYGVGGPVVGQFLSTVYMHPGHETRWSTSAEDAQPVPVGICLRLGYTSVGSVPVRMTGEYLLRRAP